MKILLEILGISSMGEKEKKGSQGLRDEAVQEKANDELSESAGEGISNTLDALRGERIEKKHAPAKRYLPPIWAIGFACIICTFFISFLLKENTPSTPSNSPFPPGPTTSSNQEQDILGWTDKALAFNTPSLANALPLPSEEWLENLDLTDVRAMSPIGSIASIYDELSHPTLPHFELPTLSDPTLILYQEEGKRIKNDLQNGLGFLFESIHAFHLDIEG
jgi:hypothetical protein